MRVYFDADFSDVDDELARLQRGPDFDTLFKLDLVLFRQLAEIRSLVHIQTASLWLSGKVIESDYELGRWSGEINFGGPVVGGAVHNPVTYAIYEQERDGFHDFMREAYDGDQGYVDAITEWYDGGSR